MKKGLFIIIYLISLASCGKQEKCDDSVYASDHKDECGLLKLSFLYRLDNTRRSLVRCAVNGENITCEQESEPDKETIPNINFFTAVKDIDQWSEYKLTQVENGCFVDYPDGDYVSIDKFDIPNSCDIRFRLYDEKQDTDGPPRAEWQQPSSSQGAAGNFAFANGLEFLKTYTMKILNTENTDCTEDVLYRIKNNTDSEYATVNMGNPKIDGTFSALFSSQATPAMRKLKKISRTEDFKFAFSPIVDTKALTDAGVTDKTVDDFFKPHMGDFLLLTVKDAKHKAYCKVDDALEGTVTVPQEILQKFDGSTGFYLTRYKTQKIQIAKSVDLLLYTTVGMYTTSNDIGAIDGTVNVWIGD